MKRLVSVACMGTFALTAIALAQSPADSGRATQPARSVAAPDLGNPEAILPIPAAPQAAPAPVPSVPYTVTPQATSPYGTATPGEYQISPETRAHEMRILESQAQAESVIRAAKARAEQRTRRLESQRWFGVSNKRPSASVDPFDGDYAAYWASNYPFYPLRWVGSGEPWGLVEAQ
jgi:hypothetical protein